MLAGDASDAAHQLRYLDQAVRRHAKAEVILQRGFHLQWLGRLAEAERDFAAVLSIEPGHYSALGCRSAARAELGDFGGAAEDAEAISAAPGWRFKLGQLQWIRGHFVAACENFAPGDEESSFATESRVWTKLCQIAQGVGPARVKQPLLSPPAERLLGIVTSERYAFCTVGAEGPLQPYVWIWDLLTELFLDRIEPNDVLDAVRDSLKQSDGWRPPANMEEASAVEFCPPPLIWRSQIQFYCGMWFLSKQSVERACLALEDAVHGDRSRTLERLAAAAQLKRLQASIAI